MAIVKWTSRLHEGQLTVPAVARTLHERVFAWMTLADERNLVQAFVAGQPHYDRDGA